MVITDSNRIGAEEDIDDYKGLSEDQIREHTHTHTHTIVYSQLV